MTEMSCGKSHAAAPNVSVSGTMIANARRVCSCTRCEPRSYTAHCASVASAMHDAWPAKNTSLMRTELSVPCVALRWQPRLGSVAQKAVNRACRMARLQEPESARAHEVPASNIRNSTQCASGPPVAPVGLPDGGAEHEGAVVRQQAQEAGRVEQRQVQREPHHRLAPPVEDELRVERQAPRHHVAPAGHLRRARSGHLPDVPAGVLASRRASCTTLAPFSTATTCAWPPYKGCLRCHYFTVHMRRSRHENVGSWLLTSPTRFQGKGMSLSAGIIRPSVTPSTSTKTSSTPAQSCASSARAALPYSRRRAPRTPGCSAAATRSASRELGRCARPGGCCERTGSALKAKACPACAFRDGGVLGPVSRLRADALVVSGMPDAQGVPYILNCAPPLPPLERWGIAPRTSTGTKLFEGNSK